jgi:folate-dependent phosphoribosylglycinamide formyltransferase PurN
MIRVFILSNDDLTSNIIFSQLFESSMIDVVGLAFSGSISKNAKGIFGPIRMLKKIAYSYWWYLVVTNGLFKIFEKISLITGYEGTRRYLFSLRQRCQKQGKPVYCSNDFNHPSFIKILQECKPDLLAIRINQILKSEILNVPTRGTWCCHSSILPSYRGIAGEFHALRRGEKVLGSTIFNVILELDKGDTLICSSLKVDRQRSLFTHMISNNVLASKMFREAVEKFAENKEPFKHKSVCEAAPSYFSWPTSIQMKEFKDQGERLIGILESISFALDCFHFRSQKKQLINNSDEK